MKLLRVENIVISVNFRPAFLGDKLDLDAVAKFMLQGNHGSAG